MYPCVQHTSDLVKPTLFITNSFWYFFNCGVATKGGLGHLVLIENSWMQIALGACCTLRLPNSNPWTQFMLVNPIIVTPTLCRVHVSFVCIWGVKHQSWKSNWPHLDLFVPSSPDPFFCGILLTFSCPLLVPHHLAHCLGFHQDYEVDVQWTTMGD